MVHDSDDFCNNIIKIIMITLHCPKTLNSISYLSYGVVYLCVAHLFTMIMKADINSKKNEETSK